MKRRSVPTVVLAVAAAVLVILSVVGDATALRAGAVVAAAFTTAVCWARGRRLHGGRTAWLPLAGAAMAWALADAANLAGGRGLIPAASAAGAGDLLGLLALVLVAAAVLAFVGPTLQGLALVRAIIDGLATGASIFLLAWTRTLASAAPASLSDWQGLFRLVVPLLDVAVVAVVVIGCTRMPTEQRRTWWRIAAGAVLVTIGDSVIVYLHLTDVLRLAHIGFAGRTAGLLLVASAGLRPIEPVVAQARLNTSRPFSILVPYAPLLVAGTELLSRQMAGRLDRPSMLIGTGLVALLGARQLVTQFENLETTRHLEKRVAERTEALDLQERRFRALARHSSDVLLVIDIAGMISYQSAATERVLEVGTDALLSRPFLDLVHRDDRRLFIDATAYAPAPPAPPSIAEIRLARSDAFVVTEISITNLLSEPSVEGMLLTVRDVSERRELEERLRHDALHDPLTGLGNRTLFSDRLEHAIARNQRGRGFIAVLLVDLDGFKVVNDSLGHAAGDELLAAVANRLRSALRPGDTVARMGGDEFAVLLDCADEEAPTTVAGRMLARLRAPVQLDGKGIVPSASIGVATARGSQAKGPDLLRNADLALYEAKNRGRCRYQVFEPGMEKEAALRVELESDLRRAIRHEELLLHYQPLLGLPSGDLLGFEALLRWQHPERGLIPPNDFIPIAEESDLIGELGRWVLRRACVDLVAWRGEHPEHGDLSVAVNVATRQLLTPWLVDQVAEALDVSGLPPHCLTLEITEGALMSDTTASICTLQALQALGVRLAIDDFGTGWSSLSRLRSFPVDKLKIDRSFVQEIQHVSDPAPLVSAITAMAHSLGLRVVAEGVETADQLACLDRLGVDEVQGYLISRPVPAPAVVSLLVGGDRLLGGAALSLDDDAGDLRSVHETLLELRDGAEVDVVFLARLDWDVETQQVVEVVASTSGTSDPLVKGRTVPLAGSPVAVSLAGGSSLQDDLKRTFPTSEFSRRHLQWLMTVPVHRADGTLWGTLCAGAEHAAPPQPGDLEAVLGAAAQLLAPSLAGFDGQPDPRQRTAPALVAVTT